MDGPSHQDAVAVATGGLIIVSNRSIVSCGFHGDGTVVAVAVTLCPSVCVRHVARNFKGGASFI